MANELVGLGNKMSIEFLQETYEEAERLRALAWNTVNDAMIAAAPIKVGDVVDYKAYSRIKTLQVTKVWVTRDWKTWRVRAEMYPFKKDGTPAKVGVENSWDLLRDVATGNIKLSTQTIADITGPVK